MSTKHLILPFKVAKRIPLWKPGLPDSLPLFGQGDLPSQPTFRGKCPSAVLVQMLSALSTSSPPDFLVKTSLFLNQKPDPNASKMLSNHNALSPTILPSGNRCFPVKCNTSGMKTSVDAAPG